MSSLRRFGLPALSALMLLFLTACGGDGPAGPEPVIPGPELSIVAFVGTSVVEVGFGVGDTLVVERMTYAVNGGAEQEFPVVPAVGISDTIPVPLTPELSSITVTAYNAKGSSTSETIVLRTDRPFTGAVSVAVGSFHACAVREDGSAYCWGSGGVLGDGSTEDRAIPVRVTGDVRFRVISAGSAHTCGLSEDARAYCWGSNGNGRLGTADASDHVAPAAVETDLRFRSIAAGTDFTCGISLEEKGYCWGAGAKRLISPDSAGDMPVPTPLAPELTLDTVVVRGSYPGYPSIGISVATVDDDGIGRTVYNGFLQPPTPVAPLQWLQGPGYHEWTTYALKRDGQLHRCHAFTAPGCPPVEGEGAQLRFQAFDGGCGIALDGAIYCGLRPLPGDLRYRTLSAGSYNACAVSEETVVYCWGYNPVVGLFPLGIPGVQNSAVPLPVFAPE